MIHASSEREVPHSPAPEVVPTPSQERKQRISILVIADVPSSLKLLFTILTENGYAVCERRIDLESHFQFVKDTLPDLVLVDVRKPETNGYQLCASLKNDPTTRPIPVIFISSIDRSINQAKALVSGAVDYVTDPFDVEEVLWRIETHISLRRLREILKSAAGSHGAHPVEPNGDLERAFREIHVLTKIAGRKHAEEKVRQSSRELKKAKEALQSSERNLAAIIDTIPTAAWTTRPDGYCDFVNQRWLDYTGISAEQAQGWGWAQMIHAEDSKRLVEEWELCLGSGAPIDTEARIRRFDHSYRWFLIRANALRDESGNILRWYGTFTDIEDRKRGEDRLQAVMSERARISAFRAEIAMALASKDTLKGILHRCAETLVHHFDAAFARIWTLKSGAADLELEASAGMYTRLDGQFGRIQLGQHKIGLIAQERKALLTNDVQNDPRVSNQNWARAEKMQSFAGYPLLVEDRVVGVMGMFSRQALTESTLETLAFVADAIGQGIDRKRAEEALDRARSELTHVARITSLNTLTASIAHEVNQPLTAVTNNANACRRLLAKRNLEPEILQQALDGIVADAARAGAVLARIRAFIKNSPVAKCEVDINDVIQEVLALAGHELQKNQVSVDCHLTETLPPVRADRVQLQQVLLNLFMNGVEAMSGAQPRTLSVNSRTDESGNVLVAVGDSGTGFGSEVDRLFTPFFTTKGNGMGMGLPISRSLIENHGGRLWAAANSPHGAVFSFTLPPASESHS
jgi:PAS domain S-box-containing protein